MWKVFMHRTFSFPSLHCYSAMDVYKCKCNTATNTKIIKIWAFPVDPIYRRYIHKRVIYWSCRTSTIYDLPINLRYIHKRVAALSSMFSYCIGYDISNIFYAVYWGNQLRTRYYSFFKQAKGSISVDCIWWIIRYKKKQTILGKFLNKLFFAPASLMYTEQA